MLDRKEIDIEIARLEYGESSYPAYAKLANLYTIRDCMDREEGKAVPIAYDGGHSTSPDPPRWGESDFLCEVKNRDPDAVWEIIDDIMDTLHTVNPRVYEGVMRKIRSC